MDLLNEIITTAPGISGSSFILLCLTSFFTSVISAAFGIGGGMMLVSIMATLLPPLAVIPVHAVIQMNSNFSRAVMLWRHVTLTWMMPFALGTLLGATIGGQVVFAIPKYLLQGTIGLFVLYSLWGPSVKATRASWPTFFGIGVFASFVTMFVGGTGPLVAPFIRDNTDERRMTVATHAAFMSLQHGVKIITFGLLGFAFGPYLYLMIGMIVLGILGTWSGKIILTWMPEKYFRTAFNVLLTALALKLLYEAITNSIL